VFPTDEIRERELKFNAKVESQVQENQELAKLVQTLEAGYASTDVGPSRSPIAKPRTEVPNAEQIAQELENYLASRSKTQGEESAE
jgi:hypothetical protein